jgi:hypothetical protein
MVEEIGSVCFLALANFCNYVIKSFRGLDLSASPVIDTESASRTVLIYASVWLSYPRNSVIFAGFGRLRQSLMAACSISLYND